jgi:pantetheine-phosphate adenylyltransferase
MQYKNIAIGGTFDKFHKGHMSFLAFAFSIGENVLIGLTTDEYVSKFKKDSIISPFEKRKKKLESFLEKKHFLSRAKIIPISDLYGPTLTIDEEIEAIVVTEDSTGGGEKINEKRRELGLPKLPLIIAPLAKEEGMVISSANIRKGITDDEGRPYIDPLWFSKTYRMPEGLRILLHKPFGKLITENIEMKDLNPNLIATVGDVTTKHFLDSGIKPSVSIIDFVVERKRKFSKIEELGFNGGEKIIPLVNSQSTISQNIWHMLIQVVKHLPEKKPQIILVDGEEDLLVLPLILSLPLGFLIFYGQPGAGFVQVEVTIQEKENARNIVSLFSGEY